MANLSDAFGTITVERVGKELLCYLRKVQGTEEQAYYKLVEIDQFIDLKPDDNGDVEIEFSTFGRWAYSENINGYLKGEWGNFSEDSDERKAYNKFLRAFIKKNGRIEIDYTDSDGGMDWMGKGSFIMEVVDGEIAYLDNFESEDLSIKGYAEQNGLTEFEALDALKGEEVAEAYNKYLEKCEVKKEVPVNIDTWYDDIYDYEEE